MDDKQKHLEFIQNVITRMNTNSFQLKGWAVTIVSAILALYASTKNGRFILMAIPATIIFWLLDAYYLSQERRYRGLYNDTFGPSSKVTLFSMDASAYKDGDYSYWSVLRSQTLWTLYSGLLALLAAVLLYLKLSGGL